MSKTTVEVRISPEKKAAAQARAREQGVTLSGGVRRLLALWIEGEIDLEALDRLPRLPATEDLEDLAQTLQALRKMLDDVIRELGTFYAIYGPMLQGRSSSDLHALLSRMRRRR